MVTHHHRWGSEELASHSQGRDHHDFGGVVVPRMRKVVVVERKRDFFRASEPLLRRVWALAAVWNE
jgi:hypothetical protein